MVLYICSNVLTSAFSLPSSSGSIDGSCSSVPFVLNLSGSSSSVPLLASGRLGKLFMTRVFWKPLALAAFDSGSLPAMVMFSTEAVTRARFESYGCVSRE